MSRIASQSRRLLRRLAAGSRESEAMFAGEPMSLDGLSAAALTESRISDAAGLGATFPASVGARLWGRRADQGGRNAFGATLGSVATDDPRSALAAAIGLSMAGQRSAAFMSGPDLASSHDLLALAAGQHLPLVIHLACRATAGHAQSFGGGHGAFHHAGDVGLFQWFTTSVQEVVDFTLIARRIAERSLIPGLVAMDGENDAEAMDVVLPETGLIREYLGEPSRQIESPTASQRLVFGDRRRLAPRYFDLDRPQMQCSCQGAESFALGAAGQRPYFQDHLPAIVDEAIDTFAKLTGRGYESLIAHRVKDAEIVLIAQGAALAPLRAFADHARQELKVKVGVIGVRMWRPFPRAEITKLLAGKKLISVLERLEAPPADEGPLLREIRLAHGSSPSDPVRFINVLYGVGDLPLRHSDLTALMHRLKDQTAPSTLFLGVDFVRDASDFPKHEAVMGALRRDYPELERLGVRSQAEPRSSAAEPVSPDVPASRRDQAMSPGQARLWDEVGVFYRARRTDELTSTPLLSTGAVAAMSSTLRDGSEGRKTMLAFDPANCDADPRLWTTCPDASISPLVISVRALIDRAIDLAAEAGRRPDALRAIASQLAKRANKVMASSDSPPATTGDLLSLAFDALAEKSKFPEDRLASLKEAMEIIVAEVGELPVARTSVFFDEPERKSAGDGELFSLIINPDTLKSPEVVLSECEGLGLVAVEQDAGNLTKARRLHQLWRRLPDVSGETIERASNDSRIGRLAGVMLSRHCQHSMAGGDDSEAGSGARLALGHMLGLAEYHLQPRQQKFLGEIEALRGKLANEIHQQLSQALPTEDLDILADGLKSLGRTDFKLTDLSLKVDAAVTTERIDGGRLNRLVDVARALADLHWRISKGHSGFGRARSGLVISAGAIGSAMGAYPWNPFQSPVVIDAVGQPAALALGLLEGQMRNVLGAFRLVRAAKRELDGKSKDETPLAALSIGDLTDDERALCPPIFVIGDGRSFGAHGLGDAARLLESNLPVKLVVLSGAGGQIDGGLSVDSRDRYPVSERPDLAMLALLSRKTFVVQASIAYPDHFARGVLDALGFQGPAMILVHAPSPERHGFAIERLFEQARLAVRSRAFPLLTFDPAKDGVFGSRLDISANPESADATVQGDDGAEVTPVDWARTEERFSHLFASDEEGAPATPQAAVIAESERRLEFWRVLQELAGVATPFTATIREEIEREFTKANQAELDRVRREYEQKIAQLRSQFEAETTQRLTRGLMTLAGYPSAAKSNGGQGS